MWEKTSVTKSNARLDLVVADNEWSGGAVEGLADLEQYVQKRWGRPIPPELVHYLPFAASLGSVFEDEDDIFDPTGMIDAAEDVGEFITDSGEPLPLLPILRDVDDYLGLWFGADVEDGDALPLVVVNHEESWGMSRFYVWAPSIGHACDQLVNEDVSIMPGNEGFGYVDPF